MGGCATIGSGTSPPPPYTQPYPLTYSTDWQLYKQQPVWRHMELQEAGLVRFSDSLHSAGRGVLPSPCVLLAPAHSLAVGPAAHALLSWHPSTRCTVIFTAAGPPPNAALRPWQREGLQTLHLPMHAHLRYDCSRRNDERCLTSH